jgi:hypothetical protein
MAMIGIFGLCIGIFFTMPYFYSTHYVLYKNAVGIIDKSEIDDIGVPEA